MEHKYNKYKIGDEAMLRVTIKQVDEAEKYYPYLVHFEGNEYWVKSEALQPYEPPKPAVWRDGAVEQPKADEIIIARLKTSEPQRFDRYTGIELVNKQKWYWMPYDEFMALLPAEPEVIEPCPFCGGECVLVQDEDDFWIDCIKECGYSSKWYHDGKEAVEAHNALGRK